MQASALLKREWNLWRNVQISHRPLGKYIVFLASSLHIGWAICLFWPESQFATPIHILVKVFGGIHTTQVILLGVATMALWFVRLKAVHPHTIQGISYMLIPQQAVLFISSIGSIVAVFSGMYADGVTRPWPFILADQLPIILGGIFYAIVTVEVVMEP